MDTNRIRINRKKHFSGRYKGLLTKKANPTGSRYKELASTINHELLHVKHPKMTEKNIRKKEQKEAERMSKSKQKRLLAKLK